MQNPTTVCREAAQYLDEWRIADQPLLDLRPEAIENYLERKANARSAFRIHRLTCPHCALGRAKSKPHAKTALATIHSRLLKLVATKKNI